MDLFRPLDEAQSKNKKTLKGNAAVGPRIMSSRIGFCRHQILHWDSNITHLESSGHPLFAQFQPWSYFWLSSLWPLECPAVLSTFLLSVSVTAVGVSWKKKKKKLLLLEVGSVGKESLPQVNRELWEGKNYGIWLRKKKNKFILVPWELNLTDSWLNKETQASQYSILCT